MRTGIRPQIETPRYLSLKPLGGYLAVNLANIERLDASAVEALEKYVAGGGGVVFFLGERSRGEVFQRRPVSRREGAVSRCRWPRQAELPVDRLEPAPDVQVEQHFIFRIFAGKRNTLPANRGGRAILRRAARAGGRRPTRRVRVVARLRNGAPLVVERSFGKGRVVAFLTTAAPTWNNWARNPSFVVVVQDLQAYLSQRPGDGAVAAGRLAAGVASGSGGLPAAGPLHHAGDEAGGDRRPLNAVASPPTACWRPSLADTDLSGFYEAQLTRTDGAAETRRYALNVDPAEGDLTALGPEQLAARLEGVKYQYEQAAAFQSTAGELAGYNLGEAILYGLVLLLVAEQILAWSASYHPAGRRGLAQGGAA